MCPLICGVTFTGLRSVPSVSQDRECFWLQIKCLTNSQCEYGEAYEYLPVFRMEKWWSCCHWINNNNKSMCNTFINNTHVVVVVVVVQKLGKKLQGLSPRANYTDRATAACRRSDCQLLRIEGSTWSAWRIPTAVFLLFSAILGHALQFYYFLDIRLLKDLRNSLIYFRNSVLFCDCDCECVLYPPPRANSPFTHLRLGALDYEEKREILLLPRLELRILSRQARDNRYTDWAILGPRLPSVS
jgi:hypothetical protein